jgi:predicted metal-dependent hydrolase
MNLVKTRNNVITYTVNKKVYNDLYISVQNGEVIINAPWYMANEQIQKIVEEKRQWILKKINEYEISCENKKEYSKIKEVKVLGKTYNLIVEYKSVKAPSLSIEKAKIMVVLPNKYKKLENDEIVKILIEKMYNIIAKKEIENIMEKYRCIGDVS